MAIANVTVLNTFLEWMIKTNQLIVLNNQMTEGQHNTSGTIRITGGGLSGNVSLNVANGLIRGDGGLIVNVRSSSLETNTINIMSNSASITVSSTNGGRLGSRIFLELAPLSTNAADQSPSNIATAQLANYISVTSGDAFTKANSATITAAAAFAVANSAAAAAEVTATLASAYGQANTASLEAGGAHSKANTVETTAIAAFAKANSATTTASGAFGKANTSSTEAAGAHTTANTKLSNTTVTLAGALTTTSTMRATALGINTPAGSTGEIRATGDITAYYSDERLKDITGIIEDALAKVKQIHGYHYTANEKAQRLGYDNKPQVGVSAQEVQRVLPEVVTKAPISYNEGVESDYLTVKYEKLIPLLIEAIKDLSTQIEEIKRKLD